MGTWLRRAGLGLVLACALPVSAQTVVNGTEYTVFWRGDLRIIATRPNTQITLIDASTGGLLTGFFTANIAGNPFELRNAGDSFEGNNGTATFRIRIIAERSRGPAEDKPVIVWTGSLETGLKHPAAPPTVTNAWMSIIPASSPGSVENGTEIGRDFWGFVSQEAYIFARVGPLATSIQIQDLATNVETDTDDTRTLTRASPQLVYSDFEMEIYHVTGFEDDTVRITSNTEISVWVGAGSTVGNDWTVTPPSWGAGEDYRELGTLFYAFVPRDLTIFPTQDNTNIVITDLSDGDDSRLVTLAQGDLNGDYDIFVADLTSRSGTGLVPRPSAPSVRLNTLGASGPFDNDFVKIEADKPVLVYVGPKGADTFEYADVAYTVQTGPATYVLYCYAQNGGADDFQLFAKSATTNVNITWLTRTQGFGSAVGHDFSIPSPTPWLGGNAVTQDYYWSSGVWSGELLRVQADGPLSVIAGDYDSPNFGCFIPFVSSSGLLRPIADAGPDLSICPGGTSITLDGSRSFDADSTPGVRPPSWTWDVNPAVDTNGNGNFVDDPDLIGEIVSWSPTGTGPWTVVLTYTDDDGQVDTDILEITSGDTIPPTLSCPFTATGVADATGQAFVNVLAVASDNCPAPPVVVNTYTTGGADASALYPCGNTIVTFTATDGAGLRATCATTVTVTETTPPDITCPALLEGYADATGMAFVSVIASASDPCGLASLVNDRTTGGADASADYPCGSTLVTFTATDIFGNVATCVTDVLVHDNAPPDLTCPARIDVLPDSPTGATVAVLATATDACDPVITVTNDRTAGGRDATDFYPCGETTVVFRAEDTVPLASTCATVVAVTPASLPAPVSPWLRVVKAAGMDPHSTAHLQWPGVSPIEAWQRYEIRRTDVDETRPYPVLMGDPTFQLTDYVDATASGPLWYYQVHVVDCAGAIEPDPLALSP